MTLAPQVMSTLVAVDLAFTQPPETSEGVAHSF